MRTGFQNTGDRQPLRGSFGRALQKSRALNAFIRHTGKISATLGITGSLFLTANRSFMEMAPVMDKMTLSGASLLGSSMVLFLADRWPVFKRVSGALGLLHIALLLADAYGKKGSFGLALGYALTTAGCAAMVFERKNAQPQTPGENAGTGIWADALRRFAEAPLLWTGIATLALKPLLYIYGAENGEKLFAPFVALGAAENLTVALMDNKVRRFFNSGVPSRTPLPRP